MNILSWNIQATKGCDGRYDAPRIVNHIKKYGDLDVICLQEVSKNIPDLNSDNQVMLIGDQFPAYEAIWGPGFSVPDGSGQRAEFGNLTLVKPTLLKYARVHNLPSPVVDALQITRTMIETVVGAGDSRIAIFNAHLAFHSRLERVEQIQALTHLRNQTMAKASSGKASGVWGPFNYASASQAVILCGDLNVDSTSDEFKTHIANQNWVDCWTAQKGNDVKKQQARQPTCGCFDHAQWPEGPHIRDYFLASENIAQKTIRVEVDVETDASDHQPVLMEIAVD